jgi:hypothetical protein
LFSFFRLLRAAVGRAGIGVDAARRMLEDGGEGVFGGSGVRCSRPGVPGQQDDGRAEPFHDTAQNRIWLAISALAQDLLACAPPRPASQGGRL